MSIVVVVISVVVVTLAVVYMLRHSLLVRTFPSETIQRMMHQILEQIEMVPVLGSVDAAYIQTRECRARLQVLIDIVGGQGILDTICEIDTTKLQNILHYHESRIAQQIEEQT